MFKPIFPCFIAFALVAGSGSVEAQADDLYAINQFRAFPVACLQHGQVPGSRAHLPAVLDETRGQVGPDVTAGAEHQRPDP